MPDNLAHAHLMYDGKAVRAVPAVCPQWLRQQRRLHTSLTQQLPRLLPCAPCDPSTRSPLCRLLSGKIKPEASAQAGVRLLEGVEG